MNDKEKMPPNATTSGEAETKTLDIKKAYIHINLSTDVDEFKRFHELLMQEAPEGYRPHFVRCLKNDKKPDIRMGGWRKTQVSFEEACEWLKTNGNIGIAALDDDLLVNIDIDDENITDYKALKPTLTCRSGSRKGVHLFYFEETPGAIPNVPETNAGEIRANNQYVLAPGSFVPREGGENVDNNLGKDTIENAIPPAKIILSEVPPVFLDVLKKQEEDRKKAEERAEKRTIPENIDLDGGKKSAFFSLTISDLGIVNCGLGPSERFPSPFHGSTTGTNTSISEDKALIHCWSHEVSLNAQQACAVLGGAGTDEEMGTKHKSKLSGYTNNGAALFIAWKYAKEQGRIPKDDHIPTRALIHIAVREKFCKEKSIKDGWEIPAKAFKKTLAYLEDAGVNHGLGKKEEEKIIEKVEGEISIDSLMSVFKKWISFDNDYDITIPLAYVLSNFSNTDPGAFGIVAPSGSYKTELIRTFGTSQNEYVYPIDNLTGHTMISGMKEVVDVIPQLQHRLITIKDFTAILAKREDERSIIFSDMREMLDGYVNRIFGSGKNVTYNDIHSSFLFGSTSAIERFYSLHATLGQRIIFYRPKNNPTEARKRALENANKAKEMREGLHTSMMQFLNYVMKQYTVELESIGETMDAVLLERIGLYVDFVAVARTHITKNYKGEIDGLPEPEFPTRLFKEVVKIITCHAILNEREIAPEDVIAGVIVLLSNIPPERLLLLYELLIDKDNSISTTVMATRLHLSTDVTRSKLNELVMLQLVDREKKGGSAGDIHHLKEEYRVLLANFLSLKITDVNSGFSEKPPEPPDLSGDCVEGIPLVGICELKFNSKFTKYINTNITYAIDNKNNGCKCSRIHTIRIPTTQKPRSEEIRETNICDSCGADRKTTLHKDSFYCDECLEEILAKEEEDAK